MMTKRRNRFEERLIESICVKGTRLCCGLDPDPARLPVELSRSENPALNFLTSVIDCTKDYVCAYKLQRAYFDLLPDPLNTLKKTILYARSAGVPTILDAKIGDTENTMLAYMDYAENVLDVDAVVVNPYMGKDVFDPFENRFDRAALVLVRTSNPGASIIQDVRLSSGHALWEHVLRLVMEARRRGAQIVPILAATADLTASAILDEMPAGMPVFVAGFGAQGGSLELIRYLQRRSVPFAVNSSRDVIFAYQGDVSRNWVDAISSAARAARATLNAEG